MIITSIGFITLGTKVSLLKDGFDSKWLDIESLRMLREEEFVPNVKNLSEKAFQDVNKYL